MGLVLVFMRGFLFSNCFLTLNLQALVASKAIGMWVLRTKRNFFSLIQSGSIPLYLAVMAGNQQVVKELLGSQAEQQVKITRGVSIYSVKPSKATEVVHTFVCPVVFSFLVEFFVKCF